VQLTAKVALPPPAPGGAGGYFDMYTQSEYEFPDKIELAINTGNIDISGGSGTAGVARAATSSCTVATAS